MCWKILGRDKKPDKNTENRKKAWLAFQHMWVAGTFGVFFVVLISNLPTHIFQIAWPDDFKYTFQIILSYGYLLWYLAYFFISNLYNEILQKAGAKDLVFDVLQSVIAFYAVYTLGFVTLKLNLDFQSYANASMSVFLICLLSLILFWCTSKKEINLIRIYGIIISIMSFIVAKYGGEISLLHSYSPYIVLIILLLFLWAILWPFIIIRIDEAS